MGVSYDMGDGVGVLTIDLPHTSWIQVCLPFRVNPRVHERTIDGVNDEQAEKGHYQCHKGGDIDNSSPWDNRLPSISLGHACRPQCRCRLRGHTHMPRGHVQLSSNLLGIWSHLIGKQWSCQRWNKGIHIEM